MIFPVPIYNNAKSPAGQKPLALFFYSAGDVIMSLKYIAAKLGISTATVSNVLNGKGRVSKDIENSILEIVRLEKICIKRRRKSRNAKIKRYIALAATGKRVFLDNVVLHERLLSGITSVLEPQGFSLLLPSASVTPGNIRDITRDADALLLLGFDDESEQYASAVPVPVIWLFRAHCETADIIHEDHKEIAMLAAQYLVDRRHSVVGFIGDPRVESLMEKGLFFAHYMKSLGGRAITATGEVFRESQAEDEGLDADVLRGLLGRLLSKRNNVTALFVPGNPLYAAVSLALWKMGRRDENALEVFPCINSPPVVGGVRGYIDINLEEIGRRAAQCVFWRFDYPIGEPMRIVVRPKLVPDLVLA